MATKKSSSNDTVGGKQLSLLTDVVGDAQLPELSSTTLTGPSVTSPSALPPSPPSELPPPALPAQSDSLLPPAVTKARSRNGRGQTKRHLTDPMDKVRPSPTLFSASIKAE